MELQIANIKMLDPINGEKFGHIICHDKKIKHLTSTLKQNINTIDGTNLVAVPGYIDIHIHGVASHDVMDATGEALHGMASALVKEGTTSFLATTMTQNEPAIRAALQEVANYSSEPKEANLLGVHLEGPFVSKKRAGAQPIEYIVAPSIELFEAWQQASGEKIRVATVAAEEPGALHLIEKHREQVIFSLGHTDANYEQMKAAIESGAQHITHLYNQMSPMHHRDIQAIGAALLEDTFFTELIVDGVHSSKQAVQIAYKMKGADRIILITDSMRAKQMPPGQYELGGQSVIVTEKDARLIDGTLAGSILTMENAVKNMRQFTNCTDIELTKMASYNAAKQLKINKGRLHEGYDADITIVDEQWNVIMTIVAGEIVYRR